MKLTVLALGVVVFVGVGLARFAPRSPAQQPQAEVATSIREDVMTDTQREHSKLFKRYRTGLDLPTTAQTASDVEVKTYASPPLGGGVPCAEPCPPPAVYPHGYLKSIAYDADAVVVGVFDSKTSQLTEDKDFVFSDYHLTVEAVLKDNDAAPNTLQGTSITVTRPGGLVELGGKTIRAVDTSFKPFGLGSRYLVFLRFLPSTRAYRAFSNGSFELRDGHVVRLTNAALWDQLASEADAKAFVREVRDAIASDNAEAPQGYVKLN